MNTCICCGDPIPEGRQVCPQCVAGADPDVILEDGTPLYLKTDVTPTYASLQLAMYDMLMRKDEKNE